MIYLKIGLLTYIYLRFLKMKVGGKPPFMMEAIVFFLFVTAWPLFLIGNIIGSFQMGMGPQNTKKKK